VSRDRIRVHEEVTLRRKKKNDGKGRGESHFSFSEKHVPLCGGTGGKRKSSANWKGSKRTGERTNS